MQNRGPRGHPEEAQAGAYGNELGDERQEVPDSQVDHGEPSPERPEAVEDQLGMSAMGGRTQADRHLLDHDRHAKCEEHKRNEKTDAKLRARGGIGKHAGPVILSQHDQHARPNQQPQQSRPGEEATLGARRRHPDTIMGAIHVFVGDDDCFIARGTAGRPCCL